VANNQTDFERLVVELQANASGLTKQLTQIARDVDRRLLQVERRTETMSRRVTTSFATAGRTFGRLGSTLLGGAALVGLTRFIGSVTELAGKVQDTAEALGVGTESLQAWGIMAARVGIEQEKLNASLGILAKNLGEAQIKVTPFGKLLDQLGIDKNAGVTEVFLQLSDAMSRLSSQTEKAALARAAFSRAGVALVPLIQQGRAAIEAQTKALIENGSVITDQNIKKLDELGDRWTDLRRRLLVTGGNVLAGFADEFIKFSDELQSPEFQDSLRQFGMLLADVLRIVAQLSPYLPNIVGAIVAARGAQALGAKGPLVAGAAVVGALGAELVKTESDLQRIKALIAEIQDLERQSAALEVASKTGTGPGVKFALDQQIAAKKVELRELNLKSLRFPEVQRPQPPAGDEDLDLMADKAQKAIDQSVADLAAARAELTRAVGDSTVAFERDARTRYELERSAIKDTTDAAITAAKARSDAEIAAFKEDEIGLAAYATVRLNKEKEFEAEKRTLMEKRQVDLKKLEDDELQRTLRLAQRLDNIATDLNERSVEASGNLTRSQTELALEIARGTEDVFNIQRDIIDETEEAEIAAVQARRDRLLEDLRREKEAREIDGEAWDEYHAKRVQAEQTAQDEIAAIRNDAQVNRLRLTEEQTQALQKQIAMMDAVRGGLEDIGTAALDGADSFKEAVVDMIKQLAILSLKLYVLRPLIEATLGRFGTTGGFNFGDALGFIGSFFGLGGGGGGAAAGNVAADALANMGARGGIFGRKGKIPVHSFRQGGVGRAGHPQISIHNEGGMNEAYVPLPDGRRIPVDLRVPPMQNVAGQGLSHVTFRNEVYLDGANGDATIRAIARQASLEAYARAMSEFRRLLPEAMYKSNRDKL